ncbi:hypothetical protein KY290_015502 [Solanum tuberosum]|uniref:Uncharacterized protein n=1 Tax=Solanum tuberosum TaxID=4113 RepID=A0ABQ7VSQ1_SOLTU|nr:hypothetical protein KY290_015502 [Solanum tuberosum]
MKTKNEPREEIDDPNPKTVHEEAWEFTGPQTSPEYLGSVPKATEGVTVLQSSAPSSPKLIVEKMRMEYKFDVNDFPKPYLTAKVEEDENAIGGGYQK